MHESVNVVTICKSCVIINAYTSLIFIAYLKLMPNTNCRTVCELLKPVKYDLRRLL